MRLTRIGYFADFFITAAVIALQISLVLGSATWLQGIEWLSACLAGLLGWTLIEYAVHRWLYHKVPFFKDVHEAHHADPASFIGAPPLIGVLLVGGLGFACLAATSLIAASGLSVGLLGGYFAYMLVHHAAHHWSPSARPWLRHLLRHHALHHHQSAEGNFGITTAFWDQAFGTAWVAPARKGVEAT